MIFIKGASSWDYGTCHIGDHRRLKQACAVLPEPSLFKHMKYGGWRKVRPKIRHLAPLDGCTCVWRTSLQRTKSAIITWDGSIFIFFFFFCITDLFTGIIRIFNSCAVLIENTVTRVTVRHHKACWTVIPSDRICSSHRTTILDSFSGMLTFRLEFVLFYQFYAEIITFFDQETFSSVPV